MRMSIVLPRVKKTTGRMIAERRVMRPAVSAAARTVGTELVQARRMFLKSCMGKTVVSCQLSVVGKTGVSSRKRVVGRIKENGFRGSFRGRSDGGGRRASAPRRGGRRRTRR